MMRCLVLCSVLGLLGCAPSVTPTTPEEAENAAIAGPDQHRPLRSMAQLEALQDACSPPMPPARVLMPREREQEYSRCRRDQRRCAERVGALGPTLRQADAELRRESARTLGTIVRSHRCHEDSADPCGWLAPQSTPQSICPHLEFAAPTLMAAAGDPDLQLRHGALDGLLAAGPRDEDIAPLAAWLRSPPSDDEQSDDFVARVADVLGRAGPRAASATADLAWLATQERPNDGLQISALRALIEIGPAAETAVPTLVGLVGSSSWSVRYHALAALSAIAPDDPRTKAAAEQAAGDDNDTVRSTAQAIARSSD